MVSAFSVTSTTVRAASASISYPKNYGTGSTQIRHEPAGHSRRLHLSKYRRKQEPAEMAEPHARAARTPAARALLLAGAILAIVLGGLFMAHPASAATAAPAAPAAQVAPVATAVLADAGTTAATLKVNQVDALAQPAGGICGVPGIGDIGGLVGLCQAGQSGLGGVLNNICTPSTPQPEVASAGIDSMISTPGGQATGMTLYDNYGIAGQYWAATGLQCSQMTSLIGNNVAGMVFDMAKSLDRVTITVYQSAAGSNILGWLSNSVDTLITALGNAIYFPFLAPVVIIGAIWLAWQGLVRKRATRTIEGTIWMVIACAAAIWLIGRPADFTGLGTSVANGTTSVLNTAFAKLPATTGSNCLPVAKGDPESVTANYSFASGTGIVDQNANELWSVLVCKPWLDGEFGTTVYAQPGTAAARTNVINEYARQLLWSQAVANNEKPITTALFNAKMSTYGGIAQQLQSTDPAVYSLFQGDQWTTRLEVAFSALFAAVAAGLLVLLIALTLIILKLGFLLLLVAGPFFLIIGVHPGFGRVIAIRWFEMLVGVLMKQVAVALVLSILLYCYSLIMGTTDQVLPWALKIMMIALVTVAVFIYRKPFQHLFSSVGYGMLGSNERAETSWRESALGFRRVTSTAASVAVPSVGAASAARATRWARRTAADGGSAADAAAGAGTDGAGSAGPGSGAGADGKSVMPAADSHSTARQGPDAGVASGRPAPPLPLPPHSGAPAAGGGSAGWARGGSGAAGSGARGPAAPPPARRTGSAASQSRTAPPAPQSRPAPPAPPSSPAPPSPRPASSSRPASGSTWPRGATPVRSSESRSSGAANGASLRAPNGAPNGAPIQAAKPPAASFWARSRRRSK
jgi:hypothetical protein